MLVSRLPKTSPDFHTRSARPSAHLFVRGMARVSFAALALGTLGVGAASVLSTGCGAPPEGDADEVDIPRFGDNNNTQMPGSPVGTIGGAAQCVAGASRCAGASTVETCNAAGSGFGATQCGTGSLCANGACIPFTCSVGDTLCFGPELHTCNADGRSTTLTTMCGAGQACRQSTRSCQPLLCDPLAPACNGNVATRCDGSGFGFDFSATSDCGTQVCNLGTCRAPEAIDPNNPLDTTQNPLNPISQACTPNQVSCAGNTLNRCNAAGTAITPQDCGASGGTCGMGNAGLACLTQRCTPGAISCEGANTIGTCMADGSGFAVERCPNGTNCTGAGTCAPVRCNQAAMLSHPGNGGVTVYWFAQGTLSSPRQEGQDVNCSFNGSRANNDDGGQNDRVAYAQDPALFGAMNFAEYAGSAACGACVRLTQGGRSVTVTVADSCNPAINNNGTCTNGHIDLSRSAFQSLTGQSTGDINGVTWNYVPCDNVDNVQFLLKKPDDVYWNQFLVVGHKYPITKAEVLMGDGRWVQARREAYNYWLPPEGDGGTGGDMGTYRVRITDVNGGIVEEQLELRAGLQGGSGQFECQ